MDDSKDDDAVSTGRAIPPPDLPRPSGPPPPSPLEKIARSTDHRPPPIYRPDAPPKISAEDDETEAVPGALASFNARVSAALIDLVLATGLIIGATMILPDFADKLGWLLGFAYMVAKDSLPFLDGRSVGKKAMKLRAVTKAGEPLTHNWTAACIRNGVLLVPLFALIEIYILLTRDGKPERGLRLGDEWAKTKVVTDFKLPDNAASAPASESLEG